VLPGLDFLLIGAVSAAVLFAGLLLGAAAGLGGVRRMPA
jgi:hypothetical protein